MRNVINTAAALFAVLCLVVTLVAAGFVVCTITSLPTRFLAEHTVTDDISPYTHDELVKCAVAIYDYAFAAHNKEALDAVVNTQLSRAQEEGRAPKQANTEEYVLSSESIAHLDDCYRIASTVKLPLLAVAILGIAACAHMYVRAGKRNFGFVLLSAGLLTIVLFLLVGAVAFIDFDAFFTLFHGLFFTQGTWTFWYKSVLICSLPENFWIGMGILWFATSMVVSILCCCVAYRCIKHSHMHPHVSALS